jgi:5-methylcytosine-specific restriction endonuclease McrA
MRLKHSGDARSCHDRERGSIPRIRSIPVSVAQSGRAAAFQAAGRVFESRRALHLLHSLALHERSMMSNALVLNADYLPLNVVTTKRAARLVLAGRAEIIRQSGTLKSVTVTIPLPTIVRRLTFIRIPTRRIALTKRNIVARDRGVCQYCGEIDPQPTVDHVMPTSRGGPNTWTNVVTACRRDNNVKANRTPIEAGMKLRRQPREPHPIAFLRVSLRSHEFDDYLNGVSA